MRMKMRLAALGLAAGLLATPTASADVIVQNTAGKAGVTTEFFGESFTTPAGGPWSSLAFNFYSDIPATTPTAAGTAFLLTQEYLGTPAALGSGTAGFLAASTGISGGLYLFGPSATLQANTKYYLYEDASLTSSGGNAIAGGAAYFAATSTSNFATIAIPGSADLQAANFTLTGTPLAVPEPSSLALCGLGAVGLVGYARRRRVTRA
jgi:hypothetical protein